jgi:hypothetical protein
MDYLSLNTHPFKKTFLCLAAAGLSSLAHATPLLLCHVSYAGTTHRIETSPVADPYPVASADIGGRFYFKAVMVGDATRVDYIKLYTYLDTRRQPVLVHQATYLPPFTGSATPVLLTGEQRVYAGPVERELLYHCTLQGVLK